MIRHLAPLYGPPLLALVARALGRRLPQRGTLPRLVAIWTYPLGATLVALAAALLYSTGATRLLLAGATLAITTHPTWVGGLLADIDATDRLIYRTKRHWRRYCTEAKLVAGDRYPKVVTEVGPPAHTRRQIVAHLLRGNVAEARRRKYIQHDVTPLVAQVGDKWREVLEGTARTFYAYPTVTSTPLAASKWRLRITADELPYTIRVADDEIFNTREEAHA